MKYLSIIKFNDGRLTPIIFDSKVQMEEYLDGTFFPDFESVILKIAFSENSNYIDVLTT